MFGWRRGSAYRHDVLYTLGILLVDDTGNFRRTLLRSYPGIETTIKSGCKENRNKNELAVTLAQLVLADAIEKNNDIERKESISKTLRAWIARDGIATFKQELSRYRSNEIDGLELRLRAALSSVATMQAEQRIEENTLGRFLTDILGALDGLSADERQRRRYVDIFENVKPTLTAGDDDRSQLMPTDYRTPIEPEFYGTQVDVDIISSPSGLLLRQKDTGEIITERRKLTQDTLRTVPEEAQKYSFVNVKARTDEIYSCLVVEPGSEVFGDMRAFWWALAKAIVRTTEAEANGTRMTGMAFADVSAHASGMWQSAIKESPIEHMRDQIMPMRNIHFQVINKMMDEATSECAKLGLKITLAMVLAVQSEDEKLERFAYNGLKKFLWPKGEEPEEFWHHETV